MIERPNAAELLAAMAEALHTDVLPETQGAAQHTVRVVANLCRILEREMATDPTPLAAIEAELADLLEMTGDDRSALATSLDARIGTNADFDEMARRVLLAHAANRLRIARPQYLDE